MMVCTTMGIRLHPIGSFRERLDHQLLVFISPSPHLCIRVNHRGNIVDNVLPLSTLVVKGHRTRCQRPKGSTDVDLGATGNT